MKTLIVNYEIYSDDTDELIAKLKFFEGAYAVKIKGIVEPDNLRKVADELEKLLKKLDELYNV